MIERGGCARFLLKALQVFAVGGEGGGQHLDRHFASESRVLGAVNFAHPAASEQFQDLVASERFSDPGFRFRRVPFLFHNNQRLSSRRSQARAVLHSRLMVAGESESTVAVSSMERPPK